MNAERAKILIGTHSVAPAFGGPAASVAKIGSGLAALGATVDLMSADGSRLETIPPGRLAMHSDYALVRSFGIWSWLNHRICRWARRRGAPLIVSPLGMLEPWALRQKALKKRAAWRAYQRADIAHAAAVHATSEAEAEALRALGVTRPIAVIPHGVDLPPLPAVRRRASANAVRTALFLSRIHPKKGLPLLIEAWARVRPENWRLLIAGPDSGGHRKEIVALARRLGVSDVVTIRSAAFGEEKEALWRNSALMALPTYSENFGNVIAEAQARAIPVITTTGTPWREISEIGAGWRVAPTIDAIEGALRKATALPMEILQAMGARGRGLMKERFSWNAAIARHAALHDWCLSGGAPPAFIRM